MGRVGVAQRRWDAVPGHDATKLFLRSARDMRAGLDEFIVR